MLESRSLYEVAIHGCADIEQALALQGPIARVLCPDEWHMGPCDMPWGFTIRDERAAAEHEPVVLGVGIYATRDQADDVVRRVGAVVGTERPISLGEGDPELFEELLEQYRIENENWEARAIAAMDHSRTNDPDGWSENLAEADRWDTAQTSVVDPWDEQGLA